MSTVWRYVNTIISSEWDNGIGKTATNVYVMFRWLQKLLQMLKVVPWSHMKEEFRCVFIDKLFALSLPH